MRKSIHNTLADKLLKMMKGIDHHYSELEQQLNVIQLFFFEVQYVVGRPMLSPHAMKAMALIYSIGGAKLAPSKEVREAFLSLSLADPHFKSQYLHPPASRLRVGWFTPWKAVVILPEKTKQDLQKWKQQSFLYCPSPKETAGQSHEEFA